KPDAVAAPTGTASHRFAIDPDQCRARFGGALWRPIPRLPAAATGIGSAGGPRHDPPSHSRRFVVQGDVPRPPASPALFPHSLDRAPMFSGPSAGGRDWPRRAAPPAVRWGRLGIATDRGKTVRPFAK